MSDAEKIEQASLNYGVLRLMHACRDKVDELRSRGYADDEIKARILASKEIMTPLSPEEQAVADELIGPLLDYAIKATRPKDAT